MSNDILNDDICDLFTNKLCDNCGKCLEEDGIDIKAINIEEISKNIEENKYLENELKLALESLSNDEALDNEIEYFEDESLYGDTKVSEDYVDAFENITYIEELGLEDELSLEELTEEIYPGILKLKRK